MGRPKNKKFITYSLAQSIVQEEQIGSRAQYQKWWDYYKPPELPRNPDWVYEEWAGWPAFLGNDNKFKNANPHQFLPYDDCMSYARATDISTAEQWFAYGKHPADVPVRPDLVYKGKGFVGWRRFLGTGKHKVAAKLEEARRIEQTQLLMFSNIPHHPPNHIKVSIHPNVEVAKKFLEGTGNRLIKAFKLEPGYDWQRVVAHWSTDYGEGEWICRDLNQMLFDIDLEWV